MKFLAILKDSLREAIDSKVFYVTVGLSLLLILLIGSISFRPVPAGEAFEHIIHEQAFAMPFAERGKSFLPTGQWVPYSLRDLETVKAPEPGAPQTGDYRFTLVSGSRESFEEA